ncbi:oxygen-independent coproporphyrinogen III oxidase [Alteromonas sp. ASW11-36]|uniref:Coproporphyrinogen-III oxidase n=1 Tax=Alteromonas arenosi TaxID=3055817 RepID=A0ABT7SWC6_9ALTE|nr:oxygen-independent coproporphyrinogen III oxidase [Alteromonas sp. ASW11-36]MDM7860497.1 oxygen-independent coproporphyrinogen III oxidase [Alteromonas sp. ASW11-36]
MLNKYNTSGPRYTSYPTALEFHEELPDAPLHHAALTSAGEGLSLYVHIPFCHSLCYYCGCNKVVTRHPEKADRYLEYLEKEIALNQHSFRHHVVKQLHLGGGTPSFLSERQMTLLIELLREAYTIADDCEISIEVDPRRIDIHYLSNLRDIGFTRLSIGVQDINEDVQQAINRVQSTEHVEALVAHAKTIGFTSVNLDLIYGLPHQTTDSFNATIDAVITMDPERISLFSYAHLPARFAAQRKIKDAWLPSPKQKFSLMRTAIERLCDSGYTMIGMDHFAKPEDDLAIAQQQGKLHRNFQGYTTHKDLDMLGLGVSSISFIGDWYLQNVKTLNEYYSRIDQHITTVQKGVGINNDDAIRRAAIMALMCNLHIDKRQLERDYEIAFDEYFADELIALQPFIDDQLVTVDQDNIYVVPHARLLVRTIAMLFDAYMGLSKNHQRFSRVI